MEILSVVLVTGIVLRSFQIGVMLYLAYGQWRELQVKTVYQPIKRLLFTLFIVNTVAYMFSLFIDMIGVFHWFISQGVLFLTAYLAINIISSTLVSAILLIVYKVHIQE